MKLTKIPIAVNDGHETNNRCETKRIGRVYVSRTSVRLKTVRAPAAINTSAQLCTVEPVVKTSSKTTTLSGGVRVAVNTPFMFTARSSIERVFCARAFFRRRQCCTGTPFRASTRHTRSTGSHPRRRNAAGRGGTGTTGIPAYSAFHVVYATLPRISERFFRPPDLYASTTARATPSNANTETFRSNAYERSRHRRHVSISEMSDVEHRLHRGRDARRRA